LVFALFAYQDGTIVPGLCPGKVKGILLIGKNDTS
jgi:hypothetical protein